MVRALYDSNDDANDNDNNGNNNNDNNNNNDTTGVCEINALLVGAFVLQSGSINSYPAPGFVCCRKPML